MSKKSKVDDTIVEELLAILNSSSCERFGVFISTKSEEERQTFLSVIRDWVKARTQIAWFGGHSSSERDELVRILQMAILGFYDMKSLRKESKKIPMRILVFDDLVSLEVLRFRTRSFADEFILWRLGFQSDNYWPLYWKCHENGLCSRLNEETVILKMLENMSRPGWQTEDDGLSVVQIWEKYPQLFESEFWHIFEHEFKKPYGFAWHDSGEYKYGSGNWTAAILEFINRQYVDRNRLLDVSLGTLSFNYSENEMRWYSKLHHRIKPTVDEIKEREEKYLELLANRNPSSVALGFEMLVQLDKAGRLDDRLFLDGIGPIFNEKPKSRPKAAVGIIERIAKRNKSLRNQAVRATIPALSHEAVDVQTAATKMILQYLDPKDNEIIAELQAIKPSLHGSVQALFGKLEQTESSATIKETPTSVTIEITPRIFGPLDLPRLESLQKLKPVGSVDELIDLAVKVLATPSEIDEIEMLVDGISRLHHLRGDEFFRKTSVLRKNLLEGNRKSLFEGNLFSEWNRFTNYRFSEFLGVAVGVWLADSITIDTDSRYVKFETDGHVRSIIVSDNLFAETYFGRLVISLADRISHGVALQPLSTATHHGGWIDAGILVERIKDAPDRLKHHDLLDKSLSLYRIAPDRRAEALKSLGSHLSGDPYVDALRALLGNNSIEISDPYYFIALQTNEKTLKHEPILQVDLSTSTISDLQLIMPDRIVDKSQVPLFGLSSVYGLLPHYENPWVRAMFQWRSNLCPAIRDPFYWHSHSPLKSEIEDNYDYPGPDAFLEPLCDPNEPVTEAAATALLIALVAKPESLATLAQDIVIASIGDGRLTADTLSTAAAFWIREKLPKRIRWIKRFQTVAVQSPGHADVVRGMLESIVSYLDAKELGGFLELLNECCIASSKSVSNPSCKTYLATLTGTGKAAKLAKKLLKL